MIDLSDKYDEFINNLRETNDYETFFKKQEKTLTLIKQKIKKYNRLSKLKRLGLIN